MSLVKGFTFYLRGDTCNSKEVSRLQLNMSTQNSMQETTVNNIINPSQEYEALLINEAKMKKKIIIPLPPPN